MKRIAKTLVAIMLAAAMLTACGAKTEDASADLGNNLTRAADEAETEKAETTKAAETTTPPETTAETTTTAEETLSVRIRNNNFNYPYVDLNMLSRRSFNTPFRYIDDDNNFISINSKGEKTVYEDVRDIYILKEDKNGNPTSAYILKTDNTFWGFGPWLTITETVENSNGYMVEVETPTTYETMKQQFSDVASFIITNNGDISYLTMNKTLHYNQDLITDVSDLFYGGIYLTDKGEIRSIYDSDDADAPQNISEIIGASNFVLTCKSKTGDLVYIQFDSTTGSGNNAFYNLKQISLPDAVKAMSLDTIIKSDNTLWAKGSNGMGQIGDGTLTDRADFVKVADNVKEALFYGYITMDNELYSWSPNNAKHTLVATLTDEYIVDRDGYLAFYKNENGGWTLYYGGGVAYIGMDENIAEIPNTQGIDNIRMPE